MKLSKTLFFCLVSSLFLLVGCDDLYRFSYENYTCQPKQTSIYEISINKLKEGAFANVSIGTLQKQVQITSLTKNEITLKTERLRLIVNRNTGSIQVYEDNFYERVECLVDKFKM